MSAREPSDRHSDLGPSSKDWQPGSPGRDEDFTPDKDLWTLSRKGDVGAGRPGEDVHSESAAAAERAGSAGGYQPGTQRPGRSWQSRRPEPGNEDDKLDQALKDSFPTSDPPQPAQPGVTGWDLEDTADTQSGAGRARSGQGMRSRGQLQPREDPWQARRGGPGLSWQLAAVALVPVLFAAVGVLRRRSRRFRPQRR